MNRAVNVAFSNRLNAEERIGLSGGVKPAKPAVCRLSTDAESGPALEFTLILLDKKLDIILFGGVAKQAKACETFLGNYYCINIYSFKLQQIWTFIA